MRLRILIRTATLCRLGSPTVAGPSSPIEATFGERRGAVLEPECTKPSLHLIEKFDQRILVCHAYVGALDGERIARLRDHSRVSRASNRKQRQVIHKVDFTPENPVIKHLRQCSILRERRSGKRAGSGRLAPKPMAGRKEGKALPKIFLVVPGRISQPGPAL